MIRKEKTFSEQVKREIVSSIFEDHCLKAILSSFLSNRLTIVLKNKEYFWRVTSQFPFIIDFIEKAFKQLYSDIKTTKTINDSATNINGQTNYVDLVGNFDLIRNELRFENDVAKDNLCENECCKRAYIAGAFLACGSVSSLTSKSYHLEIRSANYLYLCYLQALLATFGINAVLTKHSTKLFFLYIKKADQISDFLKLINAGNSMLEFEDKKIAKDFNMQITRLNNLDISNINKSSSLGSRQVKLIQKLKTMPIWNKQSIKFRLFCEARLSNPSSSLNELVKIMYTKYKIKVTKSALNHFGRKLEKICN